MDSDKFDKEFNERQRLGIRPGVIHPNPGGPTHAKSPYDKKLDRVYSSIKEVMRVAPEEDRSELVLVVGILDQIIEKRSR